MAVSRQRVRAALEPEEPNYERAAQLGPDALPHLQSLVEGDDPMLASKATYLASLIDDSAAVAVVADAAQHPDPVVRIAAATAAQNLESAATSEVLVELVGDPDPGVRKVARRSVPDDPSDILTRQMENLPDEMDDTFRQQQTEVAIDRPMPGESTAQAPASGTTGQMPGEQAGGLMPGEE